MGLTGLHCAALNEEGVVSIYFLKHNQKDFDVNVVDAFGSIPLNYAMK